MSKIITNELLDRLLAQAAENPRLRTNYNLHESIDDPVNRLCIAVQTGSRFAIQRHPDKWELLTCLRGKFIVRLFDDAGKVTEEHKLGGEVISLEIPKNTWHTLELLEPTVFLEVKPGPYALVAPEDTFPETGK